METTFPLLLRGLRAAGCACGSNRGDETRGLTLHLTFTVFWPQVRLLSQEYCGSVGVEFGEVAASFWLGQNTWEDMEGSPPGGVGGHSAGGGGILWGGRITLGMAGSTLGGRKGAAEGGLAAADGIAVPEHNAPSSGGRHPERCDGDPRGGLDKMDPGGGRPEVGGEQLEFETSSVSDHFLFPTSLRLLSTSPRSRSGRFYTHQLKKYKTS